MPDLNVYVVALQCCKMTKDKIIYYYDNSRDRENFKTQIHETRYFKQLPSQAGIRIINTFPQNSIQLKLGSIIVWRLLIMTPHNNILFNTCTLLMSSSVKEIICV